MTDQTTYLDQLLEKHGYTHQEVVNNPEERFPIPTPPYPSGRFYHFIANRKVAVVVEDNVALLGVPGHKAIATLERYTPEILGQSPASVVFRSKTSDCWVTADANISKPHNTQITRTRKGVYTTHLTRGNTGVILLNQTILMRFKYPADLDLRRTNKPEIPGAVIEQAYLIWEENEFSPEAPVPEQAD